MGDGRLTLLGVARTVREHQTVVIDLCEVVVPRYADYFCPTLAQAADDVVLAKKKVQSVSGKTVTLSLSEQEQMALSVAAVDASSYGRKSTETALLYCTRYVDASQTAAVETYNNATLSELIDSNPNIIAEAQRELAEQQEAQTTQETPTMQDASGVSSSN